MSKFFVPEDFPDTGGYAIEAANRANYKLESADREVYYVEKITKDYPELKKVQEQNRLLLEFVKKQASSECYVMCSCDIDAQMVLDKLDNV
jgi:hypothetical protein